MSEILGWVDSVRLGLTLAGGLAGLGVWVGVACVRGDLSRWWGGLDTRQLLPGESIPVVLVRTGGVGVAAALYAGVRAEGGSVPADGPSFGGRWESSEF